MGIVKEGEMWGTTRLKKDSSVTKDIMEDIERLGQENTDLKKRAEKAELKAAYWEERWRELREAVARHQAETKFPGELDKWLYSVLDTIKV